MGKVFAHTPAPVAAPVAATPARLDLWSVQQGITILSDKPRSASREEMEAYLLDLARSRGVYVPGNAVLSEAGIYVEGYGYTVPMPGYGADSTVTFDELDEAGALVRSSRIGTDNKGNIGLKADAVRKVCAIAKPPKARKAPAKASPAPVAPVEAPAPVSAPVVALAPVSAPSVDVAALAARLAALESTVARLSRPVTAGKRQRTESERRAIVRAWQMRGEMRARADLDRRALEKVNADCLFAQAERDAARHLEAEAKAEAARLRESVTAGMFTRARLVERHEAALAVADRRAARMVQAAIRSRRTVARLSNDLRGAQAEARALSRRLVDAPRVRAPNLVQAAQDAGRLHIITA